MYSFEEIVGHKEIIQGLQQGIKITKYLIAIFLME